MSFAPNAAKVASRIVTSTKVTGLAVGVKSVITGIYKRAKKESRKKTYGGGGGGANSMIMMLY